MASESSDTASNPFKDPNFRNEQQALAAEASLNVGRNASLTLGVESLIVLDEGLVEQPKFNCFGFLPLRSKKTRSIPYFNILWASISKVDITVHYANPSSKTDVRVAFLNYILDQTQQDNIESAKKWVERLLDKAYGEAQRQKRLKVLVNPVGGQGKAETYYSRDIEPIFAAARCQLDVEKTKYHGHGRDIGKDIDLNAFDAIACCSGDGLPHEVFNGLGKRKNAVEALRKMAVVNLPCGSGNAMSWNLNGTGSPSMAALCIVKGIRMPLDLVSITHGEERHLSFLSQAIGIIAEADLNTENLRWMGPARFTYGFLVRLLGNATYPCDIAVKVEIEDKGAIKSHYQTAVAEAEAAHSSSIDSTLSSNSGALPPLKFGTVASPLPEPSDGWTPLTPNPDLGNFYCGNMCYMAADAPFFPCALPNEGFMDLVSISGKIPRHTAITSIFHIGDNTFFQRDYNNYRKVSAYRIVPKFDGGVISIDGEPFPFGPLQAEVHKGLGCVLSRNGWGYQNTGPKDVGDSESGTK